MCPRTREKGGRAKARLEAKLRPREDTEPEKDPGTVKRERAMGKKNGEKIKPIRHE